MKFVSFEWFLDERYLPTLYKKSTTQILADLEWFEIYYFYHNNDPERYGRILNRLEEFTLPSCSPIPDEPPVCLFRP